MFRVGHTDTWVRWFADAVIAAAALAQVVLDPAAAVASPRHDAVADLRVDSAARELINEPAAHPVVCAAIAADLAGLSGQAARTALDQLKDRR